MTSFIDDKLVDLRGATFLLETIHESAMVPLAGGLLEAIIAKREAGAVYFRLTEDERAALAYAVALVGDQVRALTKESSP